MKTIYTFALVLLAFIGFSQAPQAINYQGVVRSGNGKPIGGVQIKVQFEIIKSGAPIYSETHTGLPANVQGIFNAQIGKGTVNSGTFAALPWKDGGLSLRVSVDTTNGNPGPLVQVGTQDIVSVPYALYAPTNKLSYDNTSGLLGVGDQSISLAGTGGVPSFTIVGNNAGLVGQVPLLPLPTPTFQTNGGPTSISGTGPLFTVNSQSVTVTAGTTLTFAPGITQPLPPGLLQVFGTFPNYSLAVSPLITYDPILGVLTLSNVIGTPPYSGSGPGGAYQYNISPNLSLSGSTLTSGTSTVALTGISPWVTNSTAPLATQTVGLANSSASVGIGVNPPLAKLHVNGYTRLGNSAPAIQIATINGTTPSANNSNTQSFPTGVTPDKIISITVMVNGALSPPDWYPPGFNVTGLLGYEYYWYTTNAGVIIKTTANSSNVTNKEVRIVITYIP